MESVVKEALNIKTLEPFGPSSSGGYISQGQGYVCDRGKLFIKINNKAESRVMFEGEHASLSAIIATNTLKVPEPILVLANPTGGAVFVMEYIEMQPLNKYSAKLGEQFAKMHLHNELLAKQAAKQEASIHAQTAISYVNQFGFHVTTCCGLFPQDNSWMDDWVEFFCRNRLQHQVDLLQKKAHGTDLRTLWGALLPRIPKLFKGISVKPSLLHGDFWYGNIAENNQGPVTFDPSSLYGHHEFDLGMTYFGGFDSSFYHAYRSLIPKAPGSDERLKLYELFHNLNHWNHFDGKYKDAVLNTMKELALP